MADFEKIAREVVGGVLVTAFTYEHGPQKAAEVFANALRQAHNAALEEAAVKFESGPIRWRHDAIALHLRALKLPENGGQ